mmetsp:Transcript_14206/g.45508  ORF Transcript_14206/g.45508 Transcript_14206/m.45508 type:complete len:790 (+) Transcript_14206:54-2423(+)
MRSTIFGKFRGAVTLEIEPHATLASYHSFWQRANSSSAAATVVFVALADRLAASPAAEGEGGTSARSHVSRAALMATMAQLVLYGAPIDPNHKDFARAAKTLGSLGEPASALLGLVGCKEAASSVTSLVGMATDDESDDHSCALATQFLLRPGTADLRIGTMVKTICGLLRLGPLLSPQRALAALALARSLVRSQHRLSGERLSALRSAAKALLLWPEPCGSSAAELLSAIHAEAALPAGGAWLAVDADARWLRRALCEVREAALLLSLGYTVYCAFDERPASDWARAARELLLPREATEEEHKAAVCEALRSMLLALARGGDSRRPAPSGSAAVSSGSALERREDVLRLAATAVDAALLASGDGSSSDPLWTAVKERQCAKLQETVQQLAATVVGGGGAATSPEPHLPPLALRPLVSSAGGSARYTRARELREAAELTAGRRYLYSPLLPPLYERLTQLAELAPPGQPAPPLRVAAVGGDGALHALLQAYVVLRGAYPDLCALVEWRFYLVPVEETSTLAQYLGARDGGYRKHVFAPLALGQPTAPQLILPRADVGGAPPSPPPTLPPADPWRSVLAEQYFRHAGHTLELAVFEARCWLAPPARTGSPPFVTIAFACSVEVLGGALASAEPSEQSVANGVGLTLALSPSDPRGEVHTPGLPMAGRFSALSFENFSTAPHEPATSPRLLFRCSTGGRGSRHADAPPRYVRAATITAGLPSAAAANADPRQRLSGPAAAAAAAAGERFSLLVDGEFYGPFACVQVASCALPGEPEDLTLPVRTCCPVGER